MELLISIICYTRKYAPCNCNWLIKLLQNKSVHMISDDDDGSEISSASISISALKETEGLFSLYFVKFAYLC